MQTIQLLCLCSLLKIYLLTISPSHKRKLDNPLSFSEYGRSIINTVHTSFMCTWLRSSFESMPNSVQLHKHYLKCFLQGQWSSFIRDVAIIDTIQHLRKINANQFQTPVGRMLNNLHNSKVWYLENVVCILLFFSITCIVLG